jgi:hypothetical protein
MIRRKPQLRADKSGEVSTMELEDEAIWLRHRLVRMRTLLRFALDPQVDAGLRELIADGEERLEAVLKHRADASHNETAP